jgi:hypothetical protein
MIQAHLTDTGRCPCRQLRLRTEGHARPEICNAASMLAQTAAAYLLQLEQDFPMGLLVTASVGDGTLALEASSCDYMGLDLHTRLDALCEIVDLGLRQLELQAPTEMHFSAPV